MKHLRDYLLTNPNPQVSGPFCLGFFVWTILGYAITKECLANTSEYAEYLIIVCSAATIIWVILLYNAIILIKETFENNPQ